MLKSASLILTLGLCIAPVAFATDPPSPASEKPSFNLDSSMILPTGERPLTLRPLEDHSCFSMRTYKVRKDMDRGSVIPANPAEVAFDPDDIIGYSTCQRAGKFAVKTTETGK